MALQAAPGEKTMPVYSIRMEILFICLDVNGDGRLDASELQGRRALSGVLKRQKNRSYLLLKDLCLQDSSPSASRLKRYFSQADRDRNHRLNRHEAKRIPWISSNFTALDGDRYGTVTLEELWNPALSGTPSAPALSGGRHHQADDANQPPESTKQEDACQERNGSDQHDGGEREHGFQQLLNAANQVIDGLAQQQHDVHLLGQLIQQDSDPCGSSQHQHDDRQLTQDGAIGEATTGAEDPSLIAFAASARLPHGIGVIRVPSLRRF